ncbi:MAG: hypothetical protein FJY11_09260 [Bacteroidetes bacterium]|nr:hypothetical protein [Bacteroidota bacterium]
MHQNHTGSSLEMPAGEHPGTRARESRIAGFIAWAVTIVFHPVFLPLYGMLLIFNIPALFSFLPGGARRVVFLMVLVNNVLLPLAMLPLFRLRNMISSYRLEDRRERIIPLLSASLMYFITAIMIYRFQLPALIKAFSFASACVVFVTALLSFRWKVSVHASGAGAMVATVLLISFKMYAVLIWVVVAVILVSGMVMTARIWLREHTPGEVYAGFLAGFTVMALAMMV